jgi:hypothetical protein
VNERIEEVAETAGDVEFVCECARMDCIETMHLSMAEYERIRSSPTHFPVAVGHDFPEFETVVEGRLPDTPQVRARPGLRPTAAASLATLRLGEGGGPGLSNAVGKPRERLESPSPPVPLGREVSSARNHPTPAGP